VQIVHSRRTASDTAEIDPSVDIYQRNGASAEERVSCVHHKDAAPSLLRGLRDSNRMVRLRAAEALVDLNTDNVAIFEKAVAVTVMAYTPTSLHSITRGDHFIQQPC
jgi:HEAT repeat protein